MTSAGGAQAGWTSKFAQLHQSCEGSREVRPCRRTVFRGLERPKQNKDIYRHWFIKHQEKTLPDSTMMLLHLHTGGSIDQPVFTVGSRRFLQVSCHPRCHRWGTPDAPYAGKKENPGRWE